MGTTTKAHKIRLNPTPEQADYLRRAAGTRRFIFNWGLAQWQQQYAAYQAEQETVPEAGRKLKAPNALELKKQFNALRETVFPWTYEVTKCVVEGAFDDLSKAFRNFFAKRARYPQWKKKGKSHESFYLSNDKFTVGDHRVQVPLLGDFIVRQRESSGQSITKRAQMKRKLGKINMAEKLRLVGKILGATICCEAGWWFLSVQVEVQQAVSENINPTVGIDVGIKEAAIVSDGRRFENQKPLTKQIKKLQRLARQLSKKVYDPATKTSSKNREKAKLRLARLHCEIACRRDDAQHKMTTEIAQTCGVIGMEDLHVKGMMKNRRLARAMADAGLGQLLTMFETKMAAVNGETIVIDRFFPSTKRCSGCGHVKKRMPLKYRTYICLVCGLVIDRDLNAARNLEQEARRLYALRA